MKVRLKAGPLLRRRKDAVRAFALELLIVAGYVTPGKLRAAMRIARSVSGRRTT